MSKIKTTYLIIILVILSGCSTTRNLPEGETLYTGIKNIEIENHDISEHGQKTIDEVTAAISVAPNNSVLGSAKYRIPFPFGLWVYNSFQKYEKGLGKWIFRKLAAEPVTISTVNPETRIKIASNLLKDYGYFDGNVTYRVDSTSNPRAVKLSYEINMGQPYKIDTVTFEGFPERADTIIMKHFDERLIHSNDNFDVTQLNNERERLVTLFKNNGYYFFRGEYISFLADTLARSGYVKLKIVPGSNIPKEAKTQYIIGKTDIKLIGYNGEQPHDSISARDFTVHYFGEKPELRYSVLRKRFLYRSGEKYSLTRQNYTQEALARLGVFKFNEFQYTPRNGTNTLDISVNSMFDLPYDSELEFNLTTKDTKQTGPGAKFNLSRKNFMRMGASLNLELKGSYEWQTSSTVDGRSSVMNSYEFGAALTLDFPRIILPWLKNRIDPFRFPSSTNFKVYADQINRAKYFKMLSFGGTVSYSFQPKRSMKHSVTPLNLAFNTLQNRTEEFNQIAAQNPMLFYSLNDQFIPSQSYTLTYDNSFRKRKNRVWWENSLTSAGNITSLIYAAFGQKFTEKDKKLLGTPFAQFLKYSSEIRNTIWFNDMHQLAFRAMGGIIWSYGNKTIAPYTEQFYVGGANSIRAFTIRSIGPGRYQPSADNTYSYVDQTGDIKLEANMEYRFRILSKFAGGNLNGAIFLDAGNVWLLRDDPARPDAQFTFNHFFDSIALGTGAGIRYDLDFLVLRLDLGIALHVPYDTEKKGYYNIPRFKDGLGLHFAIGYPF